MDNKRCESEPGRHGRVCSGHPRLCVAARLWANVGRGDSFGHGGAL